MIRQTQLFCAPVGHVLSASESALHFQLHCSFRLCKCWETTEFTKCLLCPAYTLQSTNCCAHSSLCEDHIVIQYLNFPRELQWSFPNGSGGHKKVAILYCKTITQLVTVQNFKTLSNWMNMLVNLQWLYIGKKEPVHHRSHGPVQEISQLPHQRQARRPVRECTTHRSPGNSIFFLKQQEKIGYYWFNQLHETAFQKHKSNFDKCFKLLYLQAKHEVQPITHFVS